MQHTDAKQVKSFCTQWLNKQAAADFCKMFGLLRKSFCTALTSVGSSSYLSSDPRHKGFQATRLLKDHGLSATAACAERLRGPVDIGAKTEMSFYEPFMHMTLEDVQPQADFTPWPPGELLLAYPKALVGLGDHGAIQDTPVWHCDAGALIAVHRGVEPPHLSRSLKMQSFAASETTP